MPPQTPEPDPATIKAWLAGDLPDDESTSLERYFDEHPDELPISSPIVLDHILPPLTEHDPQLSELIDLIKTRHAPELPAPSADAWQEILTPSENPGILGTLGEYEVLEVIATGGMGIVLKAHDPELNRIVALKVLSPDLATNATARERFLREARAAAKLEHENILPIHCVHADAIPYFAMRHAGGGSLQDALDAGRTFTADELKSITRKIAAALSSAHAAGIVHRDIKPGNILLDEDGEQLWVCDFGIAQSAGDPSLTYAGGIAGTPQYMSPEQAAGAQLDGRSDLFSLGAVLYRCSTGEHAFAGNTTAAVLQKVTSDDATLTMPSKTMIPKWFERLLANLLAKERRDRTRDAAAVIRAIDDEHSPRPKHATRRNRRIAILAVALASLAIAGAILLQIPAVKNLANRALAARFEQPFTIADRLGAYASLTDAVAAARDGDTIELPAAGRIAIDKFQLPAGRSLRLRPADPATRPVLTNSIAGAPGIITTAPLYIIGLDFVVNPKRASDGILIANGSAASLHIEDCKFIARRQATDRSNDIKAHTIDLNDGASADIVRCEFDLEETNAITISDTGTGDSPPTEAPLVQIRDTQMAAFFGINLAGAAIAEPGVEINIEGLDFTGQTFLKQSTGGLMPRTRCIVSSSEFNLAMPLCWIAGANDREAAQRLQWYGIGNRYSNGLAQVRVARSHAGTPDSLLSITDYGGIAATLSKLIPKPIKGTVQILGSDNLYADLGTAIDAAPDGATLLLSGELTCDREILSHPEASLHLRPAPGERPTVIARHPEKHAVFLFGRSTVSGIRFSRQQTSQFALPLLGFKSNGEDVTVENCEFVVTATSIHEGGDALSLTDVGTATVRRCVFVTQHGAGVSINFVDPNPLPARVLIEECVFISSTALATQARVANGSSHVDAKRCIAICNRLFSKNSSFDVAIHLAFEDSIIDPQDSMIQLHDLPAELLAPHLVWSGKRNYYAEGLRPLHAPRLKAGDDFSPTSLDTFEAFTAHLPTVKETGPREFPPVDRSRFNGAVSAKGLRQALGGQLDSPALPTIDLLER